MTGIDIRVLGMVGIFRDGAAVACPSVKALELLGFLITRRGHCATREAAAEALWQDEPAERTSRMLRQALWRLNSALREPGGQAWTSSPQPGWLRLELTAAATVDLLSLQAARAAAEVPAAELSDELAAGLEGAVAGYRGDFMAGCQSEWCTPERHRIRELHLSARERLITWCDARGLPERTLDHSRAALDADPARESVHRFLMRHHLRSGDRAAALGQYRRCVEALDAEYGVGPSAATTALHRAICEGRPGDSAVAELSRSPVAIDLTDRRVELPTAALVVRIQEQLGEIQATLAALLSAVDNGGRSTHPQPHPGAPRQRPDLSRGAR